MGNENDFYAGNLCLICRESNTVTPEHEATAWPMRPLRVNMPKEQAALGFQMFYIVFDRW